MTEPHSSLQSAGIRSFPAGDMDELLKRSEPVLADQGGAAGTRWVARAPACLDVIGGIAEYSGATIVAAPLKYGVAAAVRLRDDKRIAIHGIDERGADTRRAITFDLARMPECSASEFASEITRGEARLCAAAGAVHAVFATGKTGADVPGATIVVDGRHPFLADTGMVASAAVATAMALVRAWGLHFDPAECAQLALRAENTVVGFPCGAGPALSALNAQQGSLTQIDCQGLAATAHWVLPEGLSLVGVDCGHRHADADEKYARARATAFMGRLLVERILKAKGRGDIAWRGLLARLSVEDYVEHLRDHIPTKMKGADFVERYGQSADPLTTIDADTLYKIRSRTEHHIYEAERTRLFAEHFSQLAGNDGRRDGVIEAGKIMYASHWSYGQRCGLGSVETDRLVSLLRERGVESGVYGAKISGHGAGGIVVVLLEATDSARAALEGALSAYKDITGRTAVIHEGTSRGALEYGVHEV